jgi:hypothetical protein
MRKLIITLLALLCMFGLAPALCQAGSTAYGDGPFAPVVSSATNNQETKTQGISSSNTQAMVSNNTSGAAVSPLRLTTAWPLENMAPKDLVNRINLVAGDLASAAAAVIVPLAVLSMLVSCLVLVFGSLSSWEAAKRFGLGGLFMACAGLLVYYGYPLIIGLIRVLVDRLA